MGTLILILFLIIIGVIFIIVGNKIQITKQPTEEKKIKIEEMNYDNEEKNPLDKNLKIKSNTGEEFNLSLKVRTSRNDNYDNHYEVSREYTGKSEGGSYTYKYTYSNGETGTGWTSESPERYKKRKIKERIAKEASKVTIKYKGVEYDENKLIQISDSLYKAREDSKIENVPDISIDEDLSEEKKEELISWKTKMEANRWKSRQRSLRRKGKLDQYKIDSLNKLGMVWNPKEDEWEKKYLTFREYGLCDEIEEWVMDQRKSYNDNSISKENIDRLNAVKFPFKADRNEEFVFTTRSIWKLREKLQTKQRRIERKKEKKEEIYKDRRKNTSTVKLTKKEKEDRNEVSSFYNRKFHYCSDSFIYKLSEKEALDKLLQINKGESIYSGRLKYFLDSESEKFKSQGRKTPLWVRNFYSDINDDKLSFDQIYVQLSIFMSSKFSAAVRKKACIYMLKYIPNRNLNNSNSFKEINYLISAYKKEKNIDELFRLKKYIEKYPILIELYQSKIDKIIQTFKP